MKCECGRKYYRFVVRTPIHKGVTKVMEIDVCRACHRGVILDEELEPEEHPSGGEETLRPVQTRL